jgi:Ca2+-binding RTX toxin-like protein
VVDLVPYNLQPGGGGVGAPLFDARRSDDLLFGGLGDDVLHGGAGDDGLSGAEAPAEAYRTLLDAQGNPAGIARSDFGRPVNPGNVLRGAARGADLRLASLGGRFALDDPRNGLEPVALQLDGRQALGTAGVPWVLSIAGTVDDGDDVLFGGEGSDWLVGGTGLDRLWGGFGDDLLDVAERQPAGALLPSDLAVGGHGADVLLGDLLDRLIDFGPQPTRFTTPSAATQLPTILQSPAPDLLTLLLQWAASDGADLSRAPGSLPGGDTGTGAEPGIGA